MRMTPHHPLPPPTTASDGGATALSALHPDVISTHILTRLDAVSLASTASTSTLLNHLSTQEHLWRSICSSTWPSVNDPRVQALISTFPAGHRSFFYDSFPLVSHLPSSTLTRSSEISKLFSTVDIYYKNKSVFSKVLATETTTTWFRTSPFRLDLLEPKESVHTPIYHPFHGSKDAWCKNLEENLTLSWILIEESSQRCANMSSWRPVSVQRHWLTGDVQVRYATILAGDVQCVVAVMCGGDEGGEVKVREVSMVVEDMDGRSLSGEDSLVILQRVVESGERRMGKGEERKGVYDIFMEKKRVWREKKLREERFGDSVSMVLGVFIILCFGVLVMGPQKYSYCFGSFYS